MAEIKAVPNLSHCSFAEKAIILFHYFQQNSCVVQGLYAFPWTHQEGYAQYLENFSLFSKKKWYLNTSTMFQQTKQRVISMDQE